MTKTDDAWTFLLRTAVAVFAVLRPFAAVGEDVQENPPEECRQPDSGCECSSGGEFGYLEEQAESHGKIDWAVWLQNAFGGGDIPDSIEDFIANSKGLSAIRGFL